MAEISGMSPKAVDISASFNRSVAMQDSFRAQQTELEHPGFWRSVYETVPFTNGKEERLNQIEAMKNARMLCQQIQEAMAKAINSQWGGSSNIPSFPMGS